MTDSAAQPPAPAPATAKQAVVEWLVSLGDFPPGLSSAYYAEGGHTAYLQDNNGNVSVLYLRPFGEGVGGWEIATERPGTDHRPPSATYWGPDPIRHLHDALTAKYSLTDTTTEKD